MVQGSTSSPNSAVVICAAMGKVIRDLSPVPSGVLYAQVMGYMKLEQYQQVITLLKRAELVAESNHVLTWIGPKRR